MTALILPFRPRRRAAIAPYDRRARLAQGRAVLDMAARVFPLTALAYHALERGDLATARAAFDELCDEPIPDDAPCAAIDWRDAQIETLASAIALVEHLVEIANIAKAKGTPCA